MMPSILENPEILESLEKSVSKAPKQEQKSGAKKAAEQPVKSDSARKSDAFLFFALFFMPVLTFSFVLAMTQVIHLQIGDALVWEQTGDYWASLYKQTGQYFCLALLIPALASILKKKPLLARTSTVLAVLFMLLSFAFTFRAPKTFPVPPAPAPVVIEKPAAVKAEPKPAAVKPAPAIAVETPAPKKHKGWFILFPIYTKTETALSIIFPLHFQIEKESGEKYFWLLPYTQHTWESSGHLFKSSTFLYPLYTRSEVYSGSTLVSSKHRFLFSRREWPQAQAN